MLQPTKELLKELSQTHGLTRKLEELTNDEKVNELEEIWKRVTEERKTLDFQDVADWMWMNTDTALNAAALIINYSLIYISSLKWFYWNEIDRYIFLAMFISTKLSMPANHNDLTWAWYVVFT